MLGRPITREWGRDMNMDMARDVCMELHELAVRVGCGGRRVAGLLEHLARGEEHAVDERRDREHSADDRARPVRVPFINMMKNRPERGADSRSEEVRERLARLGVADEDGRDLVVEERAGDAAIAVRDVQALGRVLLRALVEVALEVRRAVLMGVDLGTQGG